MPGGADHDHRLRLSGGGGVLSVGRVADLVVLSDDIFTMPADRLHAVTAHTTLMGGRVTWQAPQ